MHRKFFVWSFDDGLEQDRRIVQTLRQYRQGATFNLNSGVFGKREYTLHENGRTIADIPEEMRRPEQTAAEHFRLQEAEAATLYRDFEVAAHTLTHPHPLGLSREALHREIAEDRKNLSALFGREITGFAAPYGQFNAAVIAELRACGIVYNRTVETDCSFRFPADPFRLPITARCIDPDIFALLERFFAAEAEEDLLFLCFAHGFEFDFGTEHASWEQFERVCRTVAAQQDLICCSTLEALALHNGFSLGCCEAAPFSDKKHGTG